MERRVSNGTIDEQVGKYKYEAVFTDTHPDFYLVRLKKSDNIIFHFMIF